MKEFCCIWDFMLHFHKYNALVCKENWCKLVIFKIHHSFGALKDFWERACLDMMW